MINISRIILFLLTSRWPTLVLLFLATQREEPLSELGPEIVSRPDQLAKFDRQALDFLKKQAFRHFANNVLLVVLYPTAQYS